MGKKKNARKKRAKTKDYQDPRTTAISIGGPIKIIKADGTVEFKPGSPEFKHVGKTNYLGSPFSKPRPRKY